MNLKNIIQLLTIVFLVGYYTLHAQEQADTLPATPSEPAINIGQGLGLYVFPSNNQDQATQDADELACYKWAKEQAGVDPINPPQIEAEQVDRSPEGHAAVGAARGAAAGAAIGAIAGDAGKGAAIGATAGAMRGRRAKVVGDAKEQEQKNAEAEAQEKALWITLKRHFLPVWKERDIQLNNL